MSDLISRKQAVSKSFHIQTDEWWGDVVSVENLMELPVVEKVPFIKTCDNCKCDGVGVFHYPCKFCHNEDLWELNKPCTNCLVKELEKIKTKIEELKPNNPNFKNFIGETRAINNVLEVIDEHISELKGETE